MSKISGKNIRKQLKADLIGKDSHRGVTLTYSWLANQVGHFSLGFIPTLLVHRWFFAKNDEETALIAAHIISAIWLVFELSNFLGPLLKKRKSITSLVYIPGKEKFRFPPAWGNIAFDTFTDLCFFWLGAYAASWYLAPSDVAIFAVCLTSITLIYPTYHWFLTKMYQQYAFFPFQFRLSQWEYEIYEEDKETALAFINSKVKGNHLLICGGKSQGKTSFGVALATEYSIKHNASIYMTASKLFACFAEESSDYSNKIWDWRNASMLVIDDLNPGPPLDEIISAEQFMGFLDSSASLGKVNRRILRQTNTIWILGTGASEDSKASAAWKSMLNEIGIPTEKIFQIQIANS